MQLLLEYCFVYIVVSLLTSLSTAAVPGESTEFLLRRHGQPSDAVSISTTSIFSFSPITTTCVYVGVWGCPIWRARVTFPPPAPNPYHSFDSNLNDTSSTLTSPAKTANTFRETVLETCGKTTDQRDTVEGFEYEGRLDGAVTVKFKINYAKILEDLGADRTCVEEALDRMMGPSQDGDRGVCRMPGEWRDGGPLWTET